MRSNRNPRPLTEARRDKARDHPQPWKAKAVNERGGSAFQRDVLALSQSTFSCAIQDSTRPLRLFHIRSPHRYTPSPTTIQMQNSIQPCLALGIAQSLFLVSPRLEGWTVDGLVTGAARVASI
jgi:hypothetical protein